MSSRSVSGRYRTPTGHDLLSNRIGLADAVRYLGKANRIIREHEATITVPAEFFDDLFDALDAPASPNAALTRAGNRARELITRD